MSLKLQIFIAIIILISFVWIINMIRRKKLDLRYALSWLCALVLLLLLDVFPQIVFWFAGFVGIDTPSNMVFFVGFLIFIVLIYVCTVSISHLSQKTKRLTQELALLRKELDEMRAESNERIDNGK